MTKSSSLLNSSKEEKNLSNQEVKIIKKPRKKLTEGGGPLACQPISGYHLRWIAINDPRDPMSMQWAEGQNYVKVSPQEQGLSLSDRSNDPHQSGSDVRRTGKDGITLVLMKQPQEDYEDAIKELTELNENQLKKQPAKPEAIGTFGKSVSLTSSTVKF